jgi:hypothetical protein
MPVNNTTVINSNFFMVVSSSADLLKNLTTEIIEKIYLAIQDLIAGSKIDKQY